MGNSVPTLVAIAGLYIILAMVLWQQISFEVAVIIFLGLICMIVTDNGVQNGA